MAVFLIIAGLKENGYNGITSYYPFKERLIHMSQAKKKPPILKSKPKDEVNKKALLWIGAVIVLIVVIVAVLQIVEQ
ncbi:hypothetical protein GCM10010911_11100 [Paenibacillus nasutitermitis]|uniref:Uncharacterized protein n=1 Tax=Paenibacillus nasutitermitis TaxID=1652958 RepID=A0A916YQ13_9BACL|nr:hypothetical protein GCM10010911_11100 [Paenibacillus nasutitermitis]